VNTANVSVGTISTDGDILTIPITFTSAVNGNYGEARILTSNSPLTTTYPKIMIRHYDSGLVANPDPLLEVNYTDSTFQEFTLIKSTSLTVETFGLTTGKTILDIRLRLRANTSLSGTFTAYWDFGLVFKETLTLPTAIRPLQERKMRNIQEIPILGREGGIQQDLGSMSPEYMIAGGLVNTTSGQSGWTNTYTADQWWQLCKGLVIETGTIQADGNPTWQWLSSDDLNAKVLVKGFIPQQVPGRVAYHDYSMLLKQFDVGPEVTANLPGITY
jgi:hypothetical protein